MNFGVKAIEFEFPEKEKLDKEFLDVFNTSFKDYVPKNSFDVDGNYIEFKRAISFITVINILSQINSTNLYVIREIELENDEIFDDFAKVEVEIEIAKSTS